MGPFGACPAAPKRRLSTPTRIEGGAMGSLLALAWSGILGAAVNLDHPTTYFHWGWFSISVANLVVIAVMVVVFLLALFVPFPKGRRP